MQTFTPSLLLLLSSMVAGYLLPNPSGRYNVTLTTGLLVDYSRNDPYAPSPTPRALMLSVFQPAKCDSTVPVLYMPNKTSNYQGPYLEQLFNFTANLSSLFLQARLPVCPFHFKDCEQLDADDFPILLFSTSYSIPRFYYNFIASAIASEGFTVITIDHPYDANIIEYPDGKVIYNNASILNNVTWDIYPRADDVSFVIDQLSNATAMGELLPNRGVRSFPTDKIGMLGHSAGGTTAIIATSQDPRIRAAIDIDGTIIGSPALPSIPQPVLFLAREDYKNNMYETWETAWPQFTGPKMIAFVHNTTHQSFSDVPTLSEASGQSVAGSEGLLGTIEPKEIVRIIVTWTREWMVGALEGRVRPPTGFPEVEVLKEGNLGRRDNIMNSLPQ